MILLKLIVQTQSSINPIKTVRTGQNWHFWIHW